MAKQVPVLAQVGSVLGQVWALAAYGVRAAALDSIATLRRVFAKLVTPMHRDPP